MSESIAILVVPRDRFSTFPRCLEALYLHTHLPFRVVLVSGGTDGATIEYLRQLQSQKDNVDVILVDHLLMQGEARNIGLHQIKERYCVVLENDTLVHENWLPPLLDCMREEGAAAVMPLVYWYRGIHAAGCMFDERPGADGVVFNHRIVYSGIRRKRIDYPECHCILIDRQRLPDPEIFDDVEPFDVDLGLMLRQRALGVFLEPRSAVTYSAPPPLRVQDIQSFKFRWDPSLWAARNSHFVQKWGVSYDPSSKLASYRRQQLKLGVARWYPTTCTVALANLQIRLTNRMLSAVTRYRRRSSLK